MAEGESEARGDDRLDAAPLRLLLLGASTALDDPQKQAGDRESLEHHARYLDGDIRDVKDAGKQPTPQDCDGQKYEANPDQRVTAIPRIPRAHLRVPSITGGVTPSRRPGGYAICRRREGRTLPLLLRERRLDDGAAAAFHAADEHAADRERVQNSGRQVDGVLREMRGEMEQPAREAGEDQKSQADEGQRVHAILRSHLRASVWRCPLRANQGFHSIRRHLLFPTL